MISNKVFISLLFSLTVMGCSDSDSSNIKDLSSDRFTSETIDTEITLHDSDTSLEWVNGLSEGSSKPETGCNPLPSGLSSVNAKSEAEFFCNNLDFGSHTDWRVPLSSEIQSYTIALDDINIIPFYQNTSCPRVVGLESSSTTAIVQTINTHNVSPIGTINTWQSTNAGVRCVRDN